MEMSIRNLRSEFLETGLGSGGNTGGLNPRQVPPECSGSTQNQPRDGSGNPFAGRASGALDRPRFFPRTTASFFAAVPGFFLVPDHFSYWSKTK
jgi:hypothetical protein